SARTRALAGFKAGRVTVLVATDIAARGLDIAQLPLVVNYDMPLVPADYIHRIGRTGRAGLAGRAVSLVSPGDRHLLQDIQRLLPEPIEHVVVEGFNTPSESLQESNRSGKRAGPRPLSSRSSGSRPSGSRPSGSRPSGSRPFGSRPTGSRRAQSSSARFA